MFPPMMVFACRRHVTVQDQESTVNDGVELGRNRMVGIFTKSGQGSDRIKLASLVVFVYTSRGKDSRRGIAASPLFRPFILGVDVKLILWCLLEVFQLEASW